MGMARSSIVFPAGQGFSDKAKVARRTKEGAVCHYTLRQELVPCAVGKTRSPRDLIRASSSLL